MISHPINFQYQSNNNSSDITKKIDNILKSSQSREKQLNELKSASKEFEAIFVHYLLKCMRSTIQKNDLIPTSNAEKIFQDMLDEHYAKIAIKRQDFGIASKIYEQFQKTIK